MFTVLIAALALQAAPASTSELAPEAEVGAVIDRLHALASTASGPAYFKLFTPAARFVGTDATERWSLSQFRAYAEPYFSKGKGWTYHPRDRVVTILPIECRCVASFDEVLDHDAYGVLRGSGVVVKTDDGWKIEQYVLSFAVPNDVADDVVALIKAHPQPASEAEPAN
ncbi:hypothetical protein BH10PSE2_BH10PSE2_17780 [soil metagenome]